MSGRLTPHQIYARTMEQKLIFQNEQTVIRMEEDSTEVKKADKTMKFPMKRTDLKKVRMIVKMEFKVEEVSDGTEDKEYEGFVKMLPNPILPTQKTIDMHMVTHTPYANWCTHCVRGRGAMYAHRVIK